MKAVAKRKRTEARSAPAPNPRTEKNIPPVVPVAMDLQNILVPVDFSQSSLAALAYAVPFAKKFGAKISLLHVIEPLPYAPEMPYIQTTVEFPIKAMEKELSALAGRTVAPRLLGQVLVRVGIAYNEITSIARDRKMDLIILTTHGYTGIKHVFMGSTAERVVRYAPCPVFVVRSREGVLA